MWSISNTPVEGFSPSYFHRGTRKERLRPAAIAEDQALYEEWYESSLSTRIPRRLQCGQEETGDVFAEEDDKVRSKHEIYELKWAGKRDADEYKKGMQKEGITVRLKTI